MAKELKFEDKKHTISDILTRQSLPAVVRICDYENCADDDYIVSRSKIPGKTEVFIQRRLQVKYCHIKILKYYDNKAVEREKGSECVLEHDTYVDEEYLIPMKYRGKVKFVHRPGSWKRYATVSQVISELPRYIKLTADAVAFPANGLGRNLIISAHTTLEVVRKFKQSHDAATYLECSDGNESYAFNEKERINCTEVEDTRIYHLFELVRFKMLPKVFLFQNVAAKDLILLDNELNSAMLTCVEGPIELLGFAEVDVLVGWIRDKEEKTYQTVLIPSGLWNVVLVQERSFHGMEEKKNYIKRKYPRCYNTEFVEKSLYMMSMDQRQVTWLRSPDFYVRAMDGVHMFEPVPTEFPESSDDESQGDYIEIPEAPPPVPVRRPITHGDTPELKDIKRRIHEKKSRFHKVHKELLGLFSHVQKKSFLHSRHVNKPPTVPERHHHLLTKRSLNDDVHSPNGRTGSNVSNICTVPDSYLTPQSSSDDDIYQYGSVENLEAHDYDYPDSEKVTEMLRAAVRNRPLPALPVSFDTETTVPTEVITEEHAHVLSNSQTSEISTSISTKREGPQYVTLSQKQAEHLFRDNLTEEDFFKYSVLETVHCFKFCGFEEFAQKCHEQRLDGSFFKNFDLNELKKEPFSLSNFSVLKVKKMIFEGWRPYYKN